MGYFAFGRVRRRIASITTNETTCRSVIHLTTANQFSFLIGLFYLYKTVFYLWIRILKTDPKCRTRYRPYPHQNRSHQSAGGL